MIVGLGTDIVEVARIAKIYEKFGVHFLNKILTPAEIEQLCPPKPERIAGLFAAKEAAVKALGTGFARGIGLGQIEIGHDDLGAPLLHFHGAAAQYFRERGAQRALLSISHERNYAVACVVLDG